MPAPGHAWDTANREWLKHETCTEDGAYRETCLRDVSHTHTVVVPASHDWGAWFVVIAPTTTAEGLERRVCKRDPSHIEERPIPRLEEPPTPTTLLITDSISHQTPAQRIKVEVPYARRSTFAFRIEPQDEKRIVSYNSEDSGLLRVDTEGNVFFARLNPFRRNVRINVNDGFGNKATCDVTVKYKWYHYILWFLFGCLWF